MGGNSENPYAGQGPVLLDIGGDVGALVVVMPAHTDGLEVELRPAGATASGTPADHPTASHAHDPIHAHDRGHGHGHGHDHGESHTHRGPGVGPVAAGTAYPHVAVVGRPDGDRLVHSLVYPAATEGDYELFVLPGGPVAMTASVTGGQVTHLSWPE
jgi:hypothetical protein